MYKAHVLKKKQGWLSLENIIGHDITADTHGKWNYGLETHLKK